MCIYLRNRIPIIAPYDIKVFKYLMECYNGKIKTPCQNTLVTFDKPLEAKPSTPQWKNYGYDKFGRPVFSVGAGVIHAKITPEKCYGNYCTEAIIPKGTKFWIDSFGDDIAAEKLIITKNKIKPNKPLIEEGLATIILKSAPENNGIRVGDYQLINDTFVSPTKSINPKLVRGQVCGFYKDGTPMICAIETFKARWNKGYNITITSFISKHTQIFFDGREITEFVKEKYYSSKYLEAFQTCINYRKNKNENWFFGACGEVMTMLDNVLYLNAARIFTGIGFIIDIRDWYWSCSEINSGRAFACNLSNHTVSQNWNYKLHQGGVIPFFASKK